jgi:SAM-dependent MidA family methyltransferase
VVARGPITQSDFLSNLGLEVRMAKLLREATSEDDSASLISSFNRLVAPEEMGTTYKVISLSHLQNSDWHEGFSKND